LESTKTEAGIIWLNKFVFIRTERSGTFNCRWIVYLCCPLLKRFYFWYQYSNNLTTFDSPSLLTFVKRLFPYFFRKRTTLVFKVALICVLSNGDVAWKINFSPSCIHAVFCSLGVKILNFYCFMDKFLGHVSYRLLLLCWQYLLITFQLLIRVLWACSEPWYIETFLFLKTD
jgi:hypothetical protein